MIWVAIGWFLIASAVVIGANSVVHLTIGRDKPEMKESRARTNAWQLLLSAAFLLSVGVSAVIRWVPSGGFRWLLGSVAFVGLLWLIRSDVTARRKSRQRSRD